LNSKIKLGLIELSLKFTSLMYIKLSDNSLKTFPIDLQEEIKEY